MEAGREVYWNVPSDAKLAFYSITALAILIFILGVWSRFSLWAKGREEDNLLRGLGALDLLKLSITKFFSPDCIFARRLSAKSRFRGVLLIAIVWSFMILFAGTILVTMDHYLNLKFFLQGSSYLVFSLVLEIAGAVLILGTLIALVRRYASPSDRIITTFEDAGFLILIAAIAVMGFATEGLRLAISQPANWDWSPVGALFAKLFLATIGNDAALLGKAHLAAWLVHGLIVQAFIAYLPFSKLFHLFAAQIILALAEKRYGGIVYELGAVSSESP